MYYRQRYWYDASNGIRQRDYHQGFFNPVSSKALSVSPRFNAFSYLQYVFQHHVDFAVCVIGHRYRPRLQAGTAFPSTERGRLIGDRYVFWASRQER